MAPIGVKGQLKYVRGHQWGKRFQSQTIERKRKEYDELLRNAPLCACGCGTKLRPTSASFDQFCKRRKGYFSKYAKGHCNRSENWGIEFTEVERSAILGTLLGDSSLHYPHDKAITPRLSFNHSIKQAEWSRHKQQVLHRMGWREREYHNNDGYGGPILMATSACMRSLVDIHDMCYVAGRKRVNTRWLDGIGGIGLAWWIGDDGSAGKANLTLHTEGFPRDSVELIADWFGKRYGRCSIIKSKKYYTVNVLDDARAALWPTIADRVPESMQYKVGACRKSYEKRLARGGV